MQKQHRIEDMEQLKQVLQTLGYDEYSINSIISRTSRLYSGLSERYRFRGRRTVLYTALYLALRLEGHAMTLNALADMTGMDRRRLASCYRTLRRVLNITVPNPSLHEYIDELVRSMVAGQDADVETIGLRAQMLADQLCSAIDGKGLNPAGVAAAIVYLALDSAGITASIRTLARLSGVSIVTVMKRIEEFRSLTATRLINQE